jgi:hypothetical protein
MLLLTTLQKQMEEMQVLDEVNTMKLRLSLLELMNHVIEKAAATDNRSPEAVKLNQDLQTIYIELREKGLDADIHTIKPKISSVIERLKASPAFAV